MAAARIRVALQGDEAMRRRLMAVASDRGARKEARGAALEVANEKLEIMQSRCPVLTGALHDSGHVKVLVSSKREDIRITTIFGGTAAPYARIVHETHRTHSKFMESVILESASTVGPELAEKIDLRRAAAAS